MGKSTTFPSELKAVRAVKTTAKQSAKSKNSKTTNAAGKGNKKNEIFRYVCEQYSMGMTEVAKMDIALAVGNKNPRSEGFSKPFNELTSKGLFTKGSKKDTVSLTDDGIKAIPEDLEVSNDPSKIQDRYIEFVQSKVKVGADKVRPLWNILKDRKPHAAKDIAAQLGYTNPRSFGNTKIIPTMKDMGLVEAAGKGEWKFTDKAPTVSASV
jgi:hypothetical protein